MTWVRLDDGFADHPKLVGIGPTALAVHVWALCYCSRHLTDGFVNLSATKGIPWVSKRSARERAIERLIGAGLWSREDGRYLIHDFLEYNPDAAKVREKRRLKAERQARWRERKKRGKRTPVDAPVDASTNTGVDASPHPAPQRRGWEEHGRALGGRAAHHRRLHRLRRADSDRLAHAPVRRVLSEGGRSVSRAGIPGRVPREYDPGQEPKLTTLWNHNPPDWDYEPAPLEHNLAQARGILARLYGANLKRIAEAESGECDDCKRHADRLRYGRLALCRRCALSRRNARDEEAA